MEQNIHNIERAVRIVAGLAIRQPGIRWAAVALGLAGCDPVGDGITGLVSALRPARHQHLQNP